MREKLITPKALAQITGFHPRTISEMGKRGDIPGAVLIGNHVRFRAQSVYEFLDTAATCLEPRNGGASLPTRPTSIKQPDKTGRRRTPTVLSLSFAINRDFSKALPREGHIRHIPAQIESIDRNSSSAKRASSD
jgi:predicted DNA-binding transcriptional regulator AlpA